MIALETNILVYARREELPQHRKARALLARLAEGPGHPGHLRRMLAEGRAVGNLVHDAHIAALVMEHGARELWTTDRDFSRFPGLAVKNPFEGRAKSPSPSTLGPTSK